MIESNNAARAKGSCLVTGAAGFIGSHLVKELVESGWKVIAFVRYKSDGGIGKLAEIPRYVLKEVEIIRGDIRDFDSVRDAMGRAESIIHLAALIGIPYSYISPLAYLKTNVEGTYNVLENAKLCGCNRVIATSTSEVYGRAREDIMNEDHPRTAASPYAASKIAADELAISYGRAFNLPVSIIRPFNCYGPRQSERAVIPAICAQALSGDQVKLGNLHTRRDYTYVTDTCCAFRMMLEADDPPGLVNVGSGKTHEIVELARRIIGMTAFSPGIVVDPLRVRPGGSEVQYLCCDNSRIKKLGWEPQVDMKNGLQNVMDYMRQEMKRGKLRTDYAV